MEYGFRLPSAFDNRPLKFEEFESKIHQKIFVFSHPTGEYERQHSSRVAEQVIRPTGLLDPLIMVRPVEGQIEDLLGEIRTRIDRGERALVTTLTVKMAEDLTDYLEEHGVKTKYMHHEVDTFERMEIIKDLRVGAIDVIVGINLLREGLDLPEVSLIAILDADKEGFLRSETSLIQTIGRAARNANGVVLMYAEALAESGGSLDDALVWLNKTRVRAGLDELTTDEVKSLAEFRRELADERGREFALEGHRWFDLVRLGLAVDYFRGLGYSLDAHNLIFPIPQSQIEIVNNPSILWQNPGFN